MMFNVHDVKFKDQLFTTTHQQMRALAMPLKKRGIDYFCYQVCHGNGVYENLTTHPHFSQLFIDEKFYKNFLSADPCEYVSGVFLSESLGCGKVLEALEQSEGFKNGLVIVESTEKKAEIFYFGSRSKCNTFFINNVSFLYQFIFSFKHSATDILTQSSRQRLLYPNGKDKTILTSKDWQAGSQSFDPSLSPDNSMTSLNTGCEIMFTARERETIEFLSSGFSAKQAGRIMGISPRTVEGFILGIKSKVGCKTTAQLLCWYFEYKKRVNYFF